MAIEGRRLVRASPGVDLQCDFDMLLGIVGGIIARRRISGAEIQITSRRIDGIGIHVAEPMDGRIVIAVLMV
jgi:hypothetical protein